MTVPPPRPAPVRMRRPPTYTRSLVFYALSVVSFVVGVVYTAEPARSLPGFLPGHVDSSLHQISYAVISGMFAVGFFFAGSINLILVGSWREQRPARPFRDGHPVHPIRSVSSPDRH